MTPATCDCHVHVFDPRRFPYVTPRRFTPGEATAAQLQARMRALGLSRCVLVQPSVYGDQHGCLLDALAWLGDQARGVAVVSRHTSPDEISRLDAAGVVGARLNLVVDHLGDPELARARLAQIENHIPVHWHVQLHVDLGVLNALVDHIERSSRTYVLDHMGLARPAQGVVAAPWQGLLRLARGGKLYVKLSAPYLVSDTGPPHDDLRPLAESLLAARADRVLWGSNWPHTQGTGRKSDADIDAVEPFREVDDQAWLDRCSAWSGAQVRALLSDNAAKLYGFDGTHAAVRPVPAAG